MSPDQKILVHCQAGEHPAAFGHIGDAQADSFVGSHLPDGLPVEAHLVVVGADETTNGAQQCGFAGPVGSDDSVLLTLLNAQDVEERLEVPVAGGDLVKLQQAQTVMLPM